METRGNNDFLEVTDRRFNLKNDYGTISEWWLGNKSFAPKTFHLPETGLIIQYSKIDVCAGFLYKTDSKICVFEFVVSDPFAHKDVRDICINILISKVIEWAEDNGFNLIYTSISIGRYIKRLEDQGFIKADTNQTHMFKVIENV